MSDYTTWTPERACRIQEAVESGGRASPEDLAAALAEIQRLQTEVYEGRESLHRACREREERIEVLEQALRKYATHHHTCRRWPMGPQHAQEFGRSLHDPGPCSCGVESALRDLGSEYTSPAGWEDRVREAVAAERKACAAIADAHDEDCYDGNVETVAALIRARKVSPSEGPNP